MKKIIVILLLTLPSVLYPQNPDSLIIVRMNKDSLITIPLKEVVIKSKRSRKSRRAYRRMTRLIRYIKKVYPYAKLAGQKLEEYDARLKLVTKESQKRKIMRQAEKEIKEEFGDDLRKLTFTQGKILLKLIDRETGESSYQLLKDLRGGFSAFFYQAFARLFGFNLKDRYNPNGKDWKIEQIVLMIERGQL